MRGAAVAQAHSHRAGVEKHQRHQQGNEDRTAQPQAVGKEKEHGATSASQCLRPPERSVGTGDPRSRCAGKMEVLMQCVFCGKGIAPLGAWRSSSGKFYCSEFCAEVETIEP